MNQNSLKLKDTNKRERVWKDTKRVDQRENCWGDVRDNLSGEGGVPQVMSARASGKYKV